MIDDIRAQHGSAYEIVVVDDGSVDRTYEIAKAKRVVVARHETNLGKGAAMATGVRAAAGDTLVFMDADATYPVGAIPELLERLEKADIVRGERPVDSDNIPAINRLGNRVFNRLLASFHQLDGHDIMSGLYGMTRAAYNRLGLESAGFDIEVEIAIKAKQRNLKLSTFDIDYQPRLGEKKLRPVRDGMNILSRVAGMAILYSPTITFVIPGLLIMALGLIGSVALADGPVFIGAVGLSLNSFVLASLGVLGGFQLVVFGVAASLYRTETGATPTRWVIGLARRPIRLGAALVGVAVTIVSAGFLLYLVLEWAGNGAGDFLETASLVLSATGFVFGLQLMSAGLFLSMFAGRLSVRRG